MQRFVSHHYRRAAHSVVRSRLSGCLHDRERLEVTHQAIESFPQALGERLRRKTREIAPEWVMFCVECLRRFRSRANKQIVRIRGIHVIWLTIYRLRFWLISPRTMNQKILYRMVHDRRNLLRTTTDKIGMREYVENHVDGSYLPKMYAHYEDADDITLDELPRSYVMKATHASGATLLVDEHYPSDTQIPTWNIDSPYPFLARAHPDHVDLVELRRLAAAWLQNPYGRTTIRPEWAYQGLRPRIMFEELLDDGRGNAPPDYKFLCFDGEPTIIQVFTERERGARRVMYTPSWQRIREAQSDSVPSIEAPRALPEMLSLARRLARNFDFVRVDLYSCDERVLVGELTHYPNTGRIVGGGRGGPITLAASAWLPSTVA